jgi:hypothetical protein
MQALGHPHLQVRLSQPLGLEAPGPCLLFDRFKGLICVMGLRLALQGNPNAVLTTPCCLGMSRRLRP